MPSTLRPSGKTLQKRKTQALPACWYDIIRAMFGLILQKYAICGTLSARKWAMNERDLPNSAQEPASRGRKSFADYKRDH
ncbi:MAG: hypothetical protein J6A79_02885 [Clostridia bacterium]|nr:hypothetical protein [Clostridia bacterium]